MGQESACEINGTKEVDLEDHLEVLRRLVLDGAHDRIPSIVDEVVNLAAEDGTKGNPSIGSGCSCDDEYRSELTRWLEPP